MAEVVSGDIVVSLSNKEANALTELLDKQEDLSPALVDLNNTLQTL